MFCIGAWIVSITDACAQTNTNNKHDTNSAELTASRYYYSKYFDEMVIYSFDNGFDVDDQFGDIDSYVIIKSASNLANAGDTVIKQKMFDLLVGLANSESEYEVDHSITVLIDFYFNLFGNRDLFEIGMKFLDPKHLYKEKNIESDYGYDYTRSLFSKLQQTMILEDREFYNSKIINLYHNAIEKNIPNIPHKVWSEFYPYLLQELASNNIQFISN